MAHDILLFLTWRTWAGAAAIDAGAARHLAALLPRLAELEGCSLLELAVLPTHVHVIVEAPVSPNIPRLAQRLKGASSRFVNRDGTSGRLLRWERRYDVRSVGRRGLPDVRAYLDRQEERHGMPLLARWSAPSGDAALQGLAGAEQGLQSLTPSAGARPFRAWPVPSRDFSP